MLIRLTIYVLLIFLLFACKTEDGTLITVKDNDEILLPQPTVEIEESETPSTATATVDENVTDQIEFIDKTPVSNKTTLAIDVNLDAGDFYKISVDHADEPNLWLNAWYIDHTYFDVSQEDSYNYRFDYVYEDQLKNHHKLELYFRKIENLTYASSNYWQLITYIDGILAIPFSDEAELIDTVNTNAAVFQFDPYGHLETTIVARQLSKQKIIRYKVPGELEESQDQLIELNFELSTQFGGSYENYAESDFRYPRIPPVATSTVDLSVNVDADVADIPLDYHFEAIDPASYHHVTATTVYDSLGEPHELTLYFRKLNEKMGKNTWALFVYYDSRSVNAQKKLHSLLQDEIPSTSTPLVMSFNFRGELEEVLNGSDKLGHSPLESIQTTNGSLTLEMTLILNRITQYGSEFSVNTIEQDGHTVYRHEIFE